MSVKRQAELLSVNRSSLYRSSASQKRVPDEDLQVMRLLDKLHTDNPTWGYRTMTTVISREQGKTINRKRVRRLMRLMGLHTIYPKPNLSKRYHREHVRPYLLRNLNITRPNQVWGIDITYIPMRKGFLYLFIIIDWFSRCIVDWELSSTIDKGFVMTCLKRALSITKPEIINSDQGSHFTNPDYLMLMTEAGVRVSMDGKGQALDNVRTERFFRTIKYDMIYIQEFDTPWQLRKAISAYMSKYNAYRPHSSIGGLCPNQVYAGLEHLHVS